MNRTGRAVVYPAPNAPFEVREYPVRDAGAGEVLVRISMSTSGSPSRASTTTTRAISSRRSIS